MTRGDGGRARALGDDPVRAREEADRLLDLGLGRLDDRGDVVADELERDRAGLEVAREAVGERVPHLERRDLARRERGGERRRALGLDARRRARPPAPAAHRPRPEARLPPPSGAATVSGPASWASSSRPIVACPAIMPVSL